MKLPAQRLFQQPNAACNPIQNTVIARYSLPPEPCEKKTVPRKIVHQFLEPSGVNHRLSVSRSLGTKLGSCKADEEDRETAAVLNRDWNSSSARSAS